MFPRFGDRSPLAAIQWALVVLACSLCLALLILLVLAAIAHASPPTGTDLNSDLHKWFESQVIPAGDPSAGKSCCAESDGHILEEEDWRIADQHYEIRVGVGWYRVWDTRVLSTSNPTGKPVAWYLNYPSGPTIFCFAPGTAS